MIGVYFRHARGNPDTSYDEIWEIVSPFLLYKRMSLYPLDKELKRSVTGLQNTGVLSNETQKNSNFCRAKD
ncbi:hypothetical protein LEP1GSC040_2988 [Leptospira santarosai str. 2000030832]|nr:hypothetical protein LEP1GSC040_2988 [Leptospira santarosai str. 2000030832]